MSDLAFPCPCCGRPTIAVWLVPIRRDGEYVPIPCVHAECFCFLSDDQEEAIIAEWQTESIRRYEPANA